MGAVQNSNGNNSRGVGRGYFSGLKMEILERRWGGGGGFKENSPQGGGGDFL